MKKLFFGGVHPRYKKKLSTQTMDFHTMIPKQVVIPMQQHIGVPCKPLVKVGEHVDCGQMIGDGEGLCVPVHASVSGTVLAIEVRPHPTLGECLAVVIENDEKNTEVKGEIPHNKEEILSAIRNAGIVGMGGAAFPGNIKALSALGKAELLIANACECEPYITADDCLLRTGAKEVLEGMMIMADLVDAGHIVLAVEDNKKEAIIKLKELQSDYPKVELKILPTRYPQGSEKQLIKALTGKEVMTGDLPISAGCLVFNVSTFAAIYQAVNGGHALTKRIVTISGEGITKPQNFIVPIGTSFKEVIEAAGGISEKTERVISGGPMMGVAQKQLSVPVVKATNSILCLLKDENGTAENPVCIRCGKCISACPMHLQPVYTHRYVEAGQLEDIRRLNVIDCLECGCCSYTCPAKLPLVESCRKGKKMLREAEKK